MSTQRWERPDKHSGQAPQKTEIDITTWSPTLTLVTLLPMASTTPAPSWPSTTGVDQPTLAFARLSPGVASFPADTRLPATSLRYEGCPATVTEVDLLEAFARHLLAWVNTWLDGGFRPVREAWLRHAQGLGEEIEVRLPRETLKGVFEDLDESGTLALRLPDGSLRRVAAGEVYLPGETAPGNTGG